MAVVFQRAQGFPKLSIRPDGGQEVRDRLYASATDYAAFQAALPLPGDTFFDLDSTVYLIQIESVYPGDSGTIWFADLVYGGDAPAFTYSLEQSPMEKAIETKTTASGGLAFLMKWKFHLAGKDITAATPAWWSTATTPGIASPDEQNWKWINDPAELATETDGTRWGIKQDRSKPGLDAFLIGSVIVRATALYASEDNGRAAVAVLAPAAAMAIVPGDTLGFPSTSGKWLLLPDINFVQEGFYWRLTCRYQYASEGWDSDIYPVYTP
jgi:hypothetical protein